MSVGCSSIMDIGPLPTGARVAVDRFGPSKLSHLVGARVASNERYKKVA